MQLVAVYTIREKLPWQQLTAVIHLLIEILVQILLDSKNVSVMYNIATM
jgi:hypothetical protein